MWGHERSNGFFRGVERLCNEVWEVVRINAYLWGLVTTHKGLSCNYDLGLISFELESLLVIGCIGTPLLNNESSVSYPKYI